MSYKKRHDGRKFTELREIEVKAGVIKNAKGSAYYRSGNTSAYAAVYGPRQANRYIQDIDKGVIRASYTMMPFSGMGNRVNPAPNRRAKEISMVTEKALSTVVKLDVFPNSVLDVYISMDQTDAGSRVAGINAAAVALADAGIPMKSLVSAVAVGRVDDALVVDLDYYEEAYDGGPVADIPMAINPVTGEVSLLQADGFINVADMEKLVEMAQEAAKTIFEKQKEALTSRFVAGDDNE